MKRRKFLIGAGSLAAGSAAAMGTGAFTSVEATRSVNVNVAGDASAYLGLEAPASELENGDYARIVDGQLVLRFNEKGGNGGKGVNEDAVSTFDEVFRIVNKGDVPIDLTIDRSGLANPERWGFAPSSIYDEYNDTLDYPEDSFYPSWDEFQGYDSTNASGGGLGPGQHQDVSVMIDTRDIDELPGGEIRVAVVETASDEGSGSE